LYGGKASLYHPLLSVGCRRTALSRGDARVMAFRLLATGVSGERPDPNSSSVFESFHGWDADTGGSDCAAVGSERRGAERHLEERWVKDVRLFRATGSGTGTNVLPLQRTSVLFLVAIPFEVSWHDLELFLGDTACHVEAMRVLRWRSEPADIVGRAHDGMQEEPLKEAIEGAGLVDVMTEFYSVVVLCHSQDSADAIYKENHGRIFYTMPTLKSAAGAAEVSPLKQGAMCGPSCYFIFLEGAAYVRAETADPHMLSSLTGAAYELPSCPLCLERLDVSCTGMVTNNRGWLLAIREGNWCPISCRTCAILTCFSTSSESARQVAQALETTCPTCRQPESLWICVVCGHVGCGRYAAGHAKDHATDMGHRFCMELGSGRVWDYAGDVFVHRRLVQTAAASGRLIEMTLPAPAEQDAVADSFLEGPKGADQWYEDELAMELDAVLASQLDYQRSVYETRLRELREGHERSAAAEYEKLREEEASSVAILAEVAQEEKKQKSMERRAAAARSSRAEAVERLEFTKELNQQLLANRQSMKPAAQSTEAAKSNGSAGPSGSRPVAPPEDDILLTQLRKRVAELMEQVSGSENATASTGSAGSTS